jgi:hypothetical protein
MGDDCINVHAQFLRVVELQDARTAIVANKDEQPFGPRDLARVGDRFVISRGGSLERLGEAMLIGAQGGPREALHFATDLPAQLRPGDLICDANNLAALTISGCQFPGNRARGVLAHSDAQIEKCSFAHQSEQGILLLPDPHWMECGSANRVKIVGNAFQDTIRLGRAQEGTITVGSPLQVNAGQLRRDVVVNQDVLISGNAIMDSGGSGIAANGVEGLVIEGNQIERSRGPAVALGTVRNVVLYGNRCTPEASVTVPADYRGEVTLTNNLNLKIRPLQ